jgi:hypothetical protein
LNGFLNLTFVGDIMTKTAHLAITQIKTGDKATGWFGKARCDAGCKNPKGKCYNGDELNQSDSHYFEFLEACCKTAGAKEWTRKHTYNPLPMSERFFKRGWRYVLELEIK